MKTILTDINALEGIYSYKQHGINKGSDSCSVVIVIEREQAREIARRLKEVSFSIKWPPHNTARVSTCSSRTILRRQVEYIQGSLVLREAVKTFMYPVY